MLVNRKNKELKLNNKGIAMISILIAIAFVSIIGSALLYISYVNYQMKVQNIRSKENFYETDGALVDLTTTIRSQLNAGKNKPDFLNSYLKLTPVVGETNRYTYDLTQAYNDASASWTTKNPYTGSNDVIDVTMTGFASSATGTNNCTIITLEKVKITQTTADSGNEKYKNTLQTDIVVTIQESDTTAKKKGVGDFAMLMDNSIDMTSTQFPFVTIYGDAFFSSYDHSGFARFPGDATSGELTYTKPGQYSKGKPAVLLANDSKLNICGDYCVVFGDMVIKDDAVCCISGGNLVVYGDIIIQDRGTIICKGKIYQPSSALPGRSTKPTVSTPDDTNKTKYIYCTPTAFTDTLKITDDNYIHFCETLALNDKNDKNDGILPNILNDKLQLNYNKSTNSYGKTIDNFNIFDKMKDAAHFTFEDFSYYGQKRYSKLDGADTVNGEFDNTLIFLGKAVKFKQANVNSTFMSKNKVSFDVQHGTVLTKLGNDLFNYMILTDENDKRYDPSVHEVTKLKDLFGDNISGLKDSDKLKFGDLFIKDPNGKVSSMLSYSVNGGSGEKTYSQSVMFKNYIKDMETP